MDLSKTSSPSLTKKVLLKYHLSRPTVFGKGTSVGNVQLCKNITNLSNDDTNECVVKEVETIASEISDDGRL